jgi:AraC-like DNA-binding protein
MIRTKYSLFNYLTVSQKDKLWGLYVTGSGYADLPPHTVYPPTQHPSGYMFDWKQGRTLSEFQLVYVTRGEGTFESIETGKKKVSEGTILALFPGVWHRYKPLYQTGWKESWVSFNGIQPKLFLRNDILSPSSAVLNIGLDEKIIDLYHKILELIESEKIGFMETIAALSYHLIARIISIDKSKKFGNKEIEVSIQKAKALMVDRIDRQIDFEELAEEIGVGYSWFRRMFKHYTGLAPAQYFLQLKLNKAKDLLLNSSLSVKEISVITGFESQYYFSKFFKKKIGMSPIQQRQYFRQKL